MSQYNDPIELLTNKGNRQNTFLFDKWNPMAGALFGFGAALMLNWGLRKPLMSGIQKHVGFTLFGLAGGKYFDNKRNEYLAKRDAVLRHYVELHPDDFPKTERKKYADVIEPWVPIR